jgi:hypothetical protein
VSDKAVKEYLTAVLNAFLAPIGERRQFVYSHPALVRDTLLAGSEQERKITLTTLAEVKDALCLTYT